MSTQIEPVLLWFCHCPVGSLQPQTVACQASLSFAVSWSLLIFMSIRDMIRLVPGCKKHSWHLKACLVPSFWSLLPPKVTPSNTLDQF